MTTLDDTAAEMVRNFMWRKAMVREIQIRECLSIWASEIEPVAAYDKHGNFLGLMIEQPFETKATILVRAR